MVDRIMRFYWNRRNIDRKGLRWAITPEFPDQAKITLRNSDFCKTSP